MSIQVPGGKPTVTPTQRTMASIGIPTTTWNDLASSGSGYSVGEEFLHTYASAVGVESGLASWAVRSTGDGVTAAYDFSGVDDFVNASTNGGHLYGALNPALEALVVKDTTDGLSNGCCLRIDSPADIGGLGAAWMCSFDGSWATNAESFGNVPFWVQFRLKIPPSRLINDPGSDGPKIMNVAQYSPTNSDGESYSNTRAEHVIQDLYSRDMPQAYHRNINGKFPPFEDPVQGRISWQNAIDRGSAFTGGDRYCWYPGTAGCEYWPTDEWITLMMRVDVQSYSGSAGNKFDLYMARAGATSWTHLIDSAGYEVGSPNSNGGGFTGLNGLHLLAYESKRTSSSVDTWHKYDQVIVSTQEIPLPDDNGIGSGQSEIQQAAGDLAAGSWVQLTTPPTQLAAMQQGTWLTGQSNDVGFDPVRKHAHFVGKAQGGLGTYRHIYYREDTHDWVTGVNVLSAPGHGYDHQAVDPLTGNVYFRKYDLNADIEVYRATPDDLTTWTMLATAPDTGDSVQVAIGMSWWSGAFTGLTQGGLVIYNSGASNGQIHIYDPVTSSWETPIASAGGTVDNLHSFMAYSPIHNVAIFGGGNINSRFVWRLNSDRSTTPMPNAPFDLGPLVDAGGYVVNNPVNGNFIAISKDTGAMQELDPTGSGSWSALATPPTNVSDKARGTIFWPMTAYGVVVSAGIASGGTSPSMWLYKPAIVATTGLDFPSNETAGSDIRLVWNGANLLPRTSHTAIWRVKYTPQAGYYALTWHSPNTGTWDSGAYSYGVHPYPTDGNHDASGFSSGSGGAGQEQYFEIAGVSGADDKICVPMVNPYKINGNGATGQAGTPAGDGTWLTQARVSYIDGSNLVHRTWPDVNTNQYIENTIALSSLGSAGGNPAFYIGASDWREGQGGAGRNDETPSGIVRGIRLFDVGLSISEIQEEAAAIGNNTAASTTGQANTWYINDNPTVADTSDKSGSGHSPTWDSVRRPSDWSA